MGPIFFILKNSTHKNVSFLSDKIEFSDNKINVIICHFAAIEKNTKIILKKSLNILIFKNLLKCE